jgi:hypothetical protein
MSAELPNLIDNRTYKHDTGPGRSASWGQSTATGEVNGDARSIDGWRITPTAHREAAPTSSRAWTPSRMMMGGIRARFWPVTLIMAWA